jgi:hypothetical protein
MLLCASAAGRRAALAGLANELSERVDWAELARMLMRQRLLPLAAQRLVGLLRHGPPATFLAHANDVHRAAQRLGMHHELATLRTAATLEDAGIATLPLKGATMSARLYGDAGMRTSQDVDVLVGAADLARAVRVLGGIGFTPVESPQVAGRVPPLHVELTHRGGLPDVEVHWRVHWHERRFSEEMLAGSRMEADGLRRAQPAHELAALLMFWARDGLAGLRLAADVARWWDVRGDRIDQGALDDLSARHPAIRPALSAAAWAAQRALGVPELVARGAPPRRLPPALRLSDWRLAGDEDQIRANVTLVDLLLAPRGERPRSFARHVLLADIATSPRARAAHAARVLARYAIAGWRIRGGRQWAPLPDWAPSELRPRYR